MPNNSRAEIQKALESICLKHKIVPAESFQQLSPSAQTWLVSEKGGPQWVIKLKGLDGQTAQAAGNLSLLHPPFEYPLWISAPSDPYQVYPYLSGNCLAQGNYEEDDIIERAQDLALHFRAMMRSMVLTDFYRESLQQKKNADPISQHRLRDMRNIQDVEEQSKDLKINLARESFLWAQETTRCLSYQVSTQAPWPSSLLDSFYDIIKAMFSIHIPLSGNNLAHHAFHPGHLIFRGEAPMAIIGWQMVPRPRFYMRGTYLAWCFLHSSRSEAPGFYEHHILECGSEGFRKEQAAVFALCLLEQFAGLTYKLDQQVSLSKDKGMEVQQLFQTCVGRILSL